MRFDKLLSELDEEIHFRENINSLALFATAGNWKPDWVGNASLYQSLVESVRFANVAVKHRLRVGVPRHMAAVTASVAFQSIRPSISQVTVALAVWERLISRIPRDYAAYERLNDTRKKELTIVVAKAYSAMADALQGIAVPEQDKRSKRDVNLTSSLWNGDYAYWYAGVTSILR
jgi:hypothetical protein